MLDIPGLIRVDFNVTDINIRNCSINPDYRMADLGDDQARFEIFDLKGKLNAKYMFITTPPLMADVGDFLIELQNTTAMVNFTAYFDEVLQMQINDFLLDLSPSSVNFEGASDMMNVVSRLLNFFGNIARDRFVSIT